MKIEPTKPIQNVDQRRYKQPQKRHKKGFKSTAFKEILKEQMKGKR